MQSLKLLSPLLIMCVGFIREREGEKIIDIVSTIEWRVGCNRMAIPGSFSHPLRPRPRSINRAPDPFPLRSPYGFGSDVASELLARTNSAHLPVLALAGRTS